MPTFKIYSDGWVADIIIQESDGFTHLYATTTGDTNKNALAGAEFVLDAFASGRNAFIRVKPEANSETDFDTKITSHKGFVRLSYNLEPGEWHYRPRPSQHRRECAQYDEQRKITTHHVRS